MAPIRVLAIGLPLVAAVTDAALIVVLTGARDRRMVQIPSEAEQAFRLKPNTDSD